jgi:endonuclease III
MNSSIKNKRIVNVILKELKRLFPNPKISLNFSNDWELYVAVVLSAQCTDKKVNDVTADLFRKYKELDDYVRADIEEFERYIKPTGFYRNKAKNILSSATIIKTRFNSKMPDSMHEMLEIPGVGRKTANILLQNIYGKVEGIAVDTHVKRLSILFGLTKNTNPDRIEKDLMVIIPRNEWKMFNYRMIEYGRKFCPARKHDHKHCPITMLIDRQIYNKGN